VPAPMFACTTPATYRQASLSANGDATGGSSQWPSIDDTGRFIAYSSMAPNLVAGDTNNTQDVFVYDDYWQVTSQRASVASDGTEANGPSSMPAISRNGEARWIAFASDATNLVPGDTNNATDIFVHDRWLGTTELVSVGANGQGNGASTAPSISADGCKIAFESAADNLVAGDTNGWPDVFVRDRCAGTTTRVSVTSSGGQARLGGTQPSIDDAGRFVAFTSGSDDIVAGDVPQNGQGYMDVFVYDGVWAVTTARASLTSDGVAANDHSYYPHISGNGRYVAFVSNATNLAANDSNGQPDVFVRDLWLAATALVSAGGPSTGGYQCSITADGRFVGFVTTASPTPGAPLAWTSAVRDMQAGDTVLPRALDGSIPFSSSTGGVAIQSHVRSVAGLDVTDRISLAFESTSTNITTRPDNAGTDIFTRTVSVP